MLEVGLVSFFEQNVSLPGGVHPINRPEKETRQCATFRRVSGPRNYSMSRQVRAQAKFDVVGYGPSYMLAKDAADKMRTAFSAYKGVMGPEVVEGVFVLNEIDDYDEESNSFMCLLEIEIHYKEESD